MDLTKIKEIAFDNMANKTSHPWKERGNKFYHGERVAKLSIKLRKILFLEDDSHDDILRVAAWFHDIKNGIKDHDHAKLGAIETRKLIKDHCTSYELDEICNIISVHDNRIGDVSYSNYIKIQQDADHIDHFGTYDIWIDCSYAIANHKDLHEMVLKYYDTWFDEKNVSKFRNELNFEISKIIYDEKMEFMQSFATRFKEEVNGNIFNEEKIMKLYNN